MTYRKTKRSQETMSRMRAGRESARMARQAPDRPHDLPDLRRRIVIMDFDFGERIHILDLARAIGHTNLRQLMTYYRKTAEDIAATM